MDNPQAVLEAIDKDRAELIRLAGEFATARNELGMLEFQYEEDMAKATVKFEVSHRERFGEKTRLPGEDIRKAYAHATVSKSWAQYLRGKANVESLEKLIRIRQSHLSSLQSELSYMTEELRRS
jgi:hypothetical protein